VSTQFILNIGLQLFVMMTDVKNRLELHKKTIEEKQMSILGTREMNFSWPFQQGDWP